MLKIQRTKLMILREITNVLNHNTNDPVERYPAIMYHITLGQNVKSILQIGLTPKKGNNNYQYNEPSVFLVDNLNADTLERVGSIVLTRGRSEQEMEQLNKDDHDSLVVLSVNMNGFNYPVYKDHIMKLPGCYFTQHTIEPARFKIQGKVDFIHLTVG